MTARQSLSGKPSPVGLISDGLADPSRQSGEPGWPSERSQEAALRRWIGLINDVEHVGEWPSNLAGEADGFPCSWNRMKVPGKPVGVAMLPLG
jgi:hypothetical protein